MYSPQFRLDIAVSLDGSIATAAGMRRPVTGYHHSNRTSDVGFTAMSRPRLYPGIDRRQGNSHESPQAPSRHVRGVQFCGNVSDLGAVPQQRV
jgi:hypothetical protein